MHRQVIAAVVTTLFVTPAQAKDGLFYAGVEGGVTFPRRQTFDATIHYTTTLNTLSGGVTIPPGPGDRIANNAFHSSWQSGHDVDAVAGYDFGALRLEAELGHKRAKLEALEPSKAFLASFNEDLREPISFGFSELPLLTKGDVAVAGGKVGVASAMLNVLVDIEATPRVSFYGGAGFGWARVKELSNSQGTSASQIIAGARYAISRSVEVGLKFRHFRTHGLDLHGGTTPFAGLRGYGIICGGPLGRPCTVRQTINAELAPGTRDRFRSQSVMASLTFNFDAGSRARH